MNPNNNIDDVKPELQNPEIATPSHPESVRSPVPEVGDTKPDSQPMSNKKEAKEPRMNWQYASLAQLESALEEARAQKKKVLVGLSGAET